MAIFTETYKPHKVAGLAVGDSEVDYEFLTTEDEASHWLRTIHVMGRKKTGGFKVGPNMIYYLGPTAAYPGKQSIPLGATILSASITFTPSDVQTAVGFSWFFTMKPDTKWEVGPRTDPRFSGTHCRARISTMLDVELARSGPVTSSAYEGGFRKFSGGFGTDYVSQVVQSSAAGILGTGSIVAAKVGTPTEEVWLELWSVDGSDEPVAKLAESDHRVANTFTAAAVREDFAFTDVPPTITFPTRYRIEVHSDQAGVSDGNYFVLGYNGGAGENAGILDMIGTYEGFMFGNYVNPSNIPRAWQGNNDTVRTASVFQQGSEIVVWNDHGWAVGVDEVFTEGLIGLLQGWIDSVHYAEGGPILFEHTPTIGFTAENSLHTSFSADDPVDDGPTLTVEWSVPDPPVEVEPEQGPPLAEDLLDTITDYQVLGTVMQDRNPIRVPSDPGFDRRRK